MDNNTKGIWPDVSARNARGVPAFDECTPFGFRLVFAQAVHLGQEAQGRAVSPPCFESGGWGAIVAQYSYWKL